MSSPSSSSSSSISSSSSSMNNGELPQREQSDDNIEQQKQEENQEPATIVEDSDSSDESGQSDSIMLEEPPKYLLKKPLTYYIILPGELGEYHPGCSARESPSCFPNHTATSPECCLWFSHGVDDEVREILRQVTAEATSSDMPRIASCVRRAQRHIYEVSEHDGFAYPNLAFGELDVCRRESEKRPRRLLQQGSELASPPTSRLRQVWNAEDLPGDDGDATESSMSVCLHPTLVAAIRKFDSGYHSPGEPPQREANGEDNNNNAANNNANNNDADPPKTRACDIDPSELAHLMALLSSIDSDSDSDDEGGDNDDFPGPF